MKAAPAVAGDRALEKDGRGREVEDIVKDTDNFDVMCPGQRLVIALECCCGIASIGFRKGSPNHTKG